MTEQGFYAWKKRPVSKRELANQKLEDEVQIIHGESRQTYGSPRVHAELRERGRVCSEKLSMSRNGNCWDKAVAESFFHSFKVEAIHGVTFETRRSMEQEVFDYIERFYNRVRRHSSIGYRSPEQFERLQIEQKIAA